MEKDKRENTAGYLAVCIDDIPNDFRPLMTSFDFEDGLINHKDAFIWLANLFGDKKRCDTTIDIIKKWANEVKTGSDDFLSLKEALAPVVNSTFLHFLSSYTLAWYYNFAEQRNADDNSDLAGACCMAARFADLLCDPTNECESGLENRDVIICTVSSMDDVGLAFNAAYRPLFGYCGDKFTYLNVVTFRDLMSVVNFAALSILKDGVIVRKCRNCGDYFIPSSRSDEIYCDKQLPNGRTCKTVGYDERVKQDQVLSEYRKIYKTQNARKQRNKQRPDIDIKFKRWAVFAKSMLIKCQSGEIGLDDMVSAISLDDWIRKGD